MIKIIIHITKFIIATITALLFASCNLNMNTVEGSGNVTTEKRIVQGDFKSIDVSNAIDLVIEQADVTEIVVEADDNLQNEIVTKVENGTLVIKCKFNSFRNVTSAASIQSKNLLQGENIDLESSSAATMDLNIESDNISCKASSGSSITVQGKALKIKTKASSGSSIDAGKLMANEVEADASSGATLEVHPIVSLKAGASSGANINYVSTPKTIEKTSSSGGSVNKR